VRTEENNTNRKAIQPAMRLFIWNSREISAPAKRTPMAVRRI
jgi:hypothetical protein